MGADGGGCLRLQGVWGCCCLQQTCATGSPLVCLAQNRVAQFIRICRWLKLIYKKQLAPLENAPFSVQWARKRCRVAQRFRQYLRATNCYKLSDHFLVMVEQYLHALTPHGQILTCQIGMDAYQDDCGWALTYADLVRLGCQFPMQVAPLAELVYAITVRP